MQNSLNRDLLSAIQDRCSRKIYSPGDALIRKGESINRFMVIRNGRAKLTARSEDGRDYVLFYTRKNEPLGEIEFFSSGVSTVDVTALSECEVFSLDMELLKRMAQANAGIYQMIGESVAFKLRRANHKNLINLMYPLKERLAGYIYSQVTGASSGEIRSDTLKDMSDLMGTSYRHLNRVILQLCEEGYLKRSRWGVTVTDRDGLKCVAGDSCLF